MIYLLKRRLKLEQGPEQAHRIYLMERRFLGPEQAHMIELYLGMVVEDAGESKVDRCTTQIVSAGRWRTATRSTRSCAVQRALVKGSGHVEGT